MPKRSAKPATRGKPAALGFSRKCGCSCWYCLCTLDGHCGSAKCGHPVLHPEDHYKDHPDPRGQWPRGRKERTMALIKKDSYIGWSVDLGDDAIKAEMGEQLKVSDGELSSAINMENVADTLFARILKNRSKAHQLLLDKVPGARG